MTTVVERPPLMVTGPLPGGRLGRGRELRQIDPDLFTEISICLLNLAGAVSLIRLVRGPWVLPVTLAIVGMHLVCGVTRRLPFRLAGVLIDLLALFLICCWTTLGQFTWWGVPTERTLDHFNKLLGSIQGAFSGHTPFTLHPPLLLALVGASALASLTACWVSFGLPSAMIGMAGPLVCFTAWSAVALRS